MANCRWVVVILAALFVAISCLPNCVGGESVTATPEMRRIFVPTGRMEEVLRNAIPVRREEVDRLWQEQKQGIQGFVRSPQVPLQLSLKANWESPRALRGTVTYVLPERQPSSIPMLLGPFEIPLESAMLEYQDGQQVPFDPVFDLQGNIQITRADVRSVHLDFVSIGNERPDGAVIFATEFPKALRSGIEIRHPSKFELSLGVPSQIVIEEVDEVTRISQGNVAGGIRELRFRSHDPKQTRDLGWFHEQMLVDATLTHQNFESHLLLELTHGMPEILRIALLPGLQIREVAANEVPLEFRTVEEAGKSSLLVVVPDNLARDNLTIRLRGRVEIPFGKNWNLPRLDAEQFAWGSRRTTLQMSSQLGLQALQPRNCELLQVDTDQAQSTVDRFQFMHDNPEALVRVQIVPQGFRGTFQVDEETILSKGRSRFQAVLQLNVLDGECFLFKFRLQQGWRIETVESLSENPVDDWFADEDGADTAVQIRLKSSVQSSEPLRIRIRGEGPGIAEAKWIPASELQLVNFPESIVTDHQLRIRGDLGVSVSNQTVGFPLQATNAQSKLVAGELVIDAMAMANDTSVYVEPSVLVSDAQLETAVSLIPGQMVQKFRIRYPTRSETSAIHLRIEPSYENDITWTVVGAGQSRLTAIREDSPKGSSGESAETWTLAIPKDSDEEFEIVGDRVVPISMSLPDPILIPIVRLTSTASKKGLLHVDVAPELKQTWTVQSALDRMPSRDSTDESRTSTWEFAYDAGEFPVAESPPRFIRATGQWHSVWTEHASTETYWNSGRNVYHVTQYTLSHLGAQRIGITELPGMQIVKVQRDGQQIRRTEFGWNVDLPSDQRTTLLTVSYETSEVQCRISAELKSQLPAMDCPILGHTWQVKLPAAYEIDSNQSDMHGPGPWLAPFQLIIETCRRLASRATDVHAFQIASQRSSCRLVSRDHCCLLGWGISHILVVAILALNLQWRSFAIAGAVATLCVARETSPWQQVGSGIVLGMSLGMILMWARSTLTKSQSIGWRMVKKISTPEVARVVLILSGASMIGAPGFSDNPPSITPVEPLGMPQSVSVNRYVPLDNAGQVTGEYDYLDPEVYAELLSVQDRERTGNLGLISARYRLEFDRDAAPPQETLFEAEFEIATSSPSELLQLPWRIPSDWSSGIEAWVNDDSVRARYSETDGIVHAYVSIPAGRHHLRLRFANDVRQGRVRHRWASNLPKCPIADLEVRLPQMMGSAQLLGSRGTFVYSNLEHILRAQLGPTQRIELLFNVKQPPLIQEIASEGIEILQLEKGRLRVDAYWKCEDVPFEKVVSVFVPQTAILDRNLASQFIEPEDNPGPKAEDAQDAKRLRADIDLSQQQTSKNDSVHLTYFLPVAALSQFIPGAWSADPEKHQTKVWLAFDGELSERYRLVANGQALPEISSAEGDSIRDRLDCPVGVSRRFFRIPFGKDLAIRPRADREDFKVEGYEEEFRFGPSGRVRCSWTFGIAECPPTRRMFQLEMPQECTAESLIVEAHGESIPCRWITAQDGRWMLILAGAAPRTFQIKVACQMMAEKGSEWELPTLTIVGKPQGRRRGRFCFPRNMNLITDAAVRDLDVSSSQLVRDVFSEDWKWKQFDLESDAPLRVLLADAAIPIIVSENSKLENLNPPLRLIDLRPSPDALLVQTRWWLPPHGLHEPVIAVHPESTILSVSLGGQPITIRKLDRDEMFLEPLRTAGSLPLEIWVAIPRVVVSSGPVDPPGLKGTPASRTLWRYHRAENLPIAWTLPLAQRLSAREFEGECLLALLKTARANATYWVASPTAIRGTSLAMWQAQAIELLPDLMGTEDAFVTSASKFEEFASADEITELRTLLQVATTLTDPVVRLPRELSPKKNDTENYVRFASKNEVGSIQGISKYPVEKSSSFEVLRGVATLLFTAFICLTVRLGRRF